MYLTKIPINRRRRGAGKLLGYPQAMHAAVESSFSPIDLDGQSSRNLWRVDSPTQDETLLYIVSPVEPDLSHVVEQAGWQSGRMWQTRSYLPVLDSLREGDRYAFRLRANPVHSVSKHRGQESKPVAHVTVQQQTTWLLDRAASRGFVITQRPTGEPSLEVVERGTMQFGKAGNSGRNRSVVTIGFATYEGVLEVADPELLRDSLINGIGRAKAYGCGLMTLAQVGSSRR